MEYERGRVLLRQLQTGLSIKPNERFYPGLTVMNTLFELPLELTKTLNILGGLQKEASFFYQRAPVNHRCSRALPLHFLLPFCFLLFLMSLKYIKASY